MKLCIMLSMFILLAFSEPMWARISEYSMHNNKEYYYLEDNAQKVKIEFILSESGLLRWIVWYRKGELSHYSSFDQGRIMMTFENFRTIPTILSERARSQHFDNCECNCSCKYTSYYPNGIIKEKGTLIYNEGVEPEVCSFEYGKWYYYDEKGNLKYTKFYR